MPPTDTRQRILDEARALLASDGLAAVSFDAIARRIGKSKQAVLYWFPGKRDLLAALFLPWLEAETETAVAALADMPSDADAIIRFVRAVSDFHLADLDRFRMMYLAPQVAGHRALVDPTALEAVHPVTTRLYDALSRHLGGTQEARRQAVAIHASVLGLVMMVALADAMGDPLKHPTEALVEALIGRLTGGQPS
jgi:AcrR family transcriptional regulator